MNNSIWLAVYVTQQHLFGQDAQGVQGDIAIKGVCRLCALLGAVLAIIVYFIMTKLWRK